MQLTHAAVVEGYNKDDAILQVMYTPWLAILKSRAEIACLIAHVCNNWMLYTLITGLPMFMNEVLKFDIKKVRSLKV